MLVKNEKNEKNENLIEAIQAREKPGSCISCSWECRRV
jgi:hypothetical protein